MGQADLPCVAYSYGQAVTLIEVPARIRERRRAEAQAAPDGFFENAQAFDGAVSGFGKLGAREGFAQSFDQRVVAALDAAEAFCGTERVFGWFSHGWNGDL